jgi:hypothetical protein
MAHAIGAIHERGQRIPIRRPRLALPRGEAPAWHDAWLRAPRAAAAAVVGTLGFGAVVGSLVAGSAASPVSPLFVVERPQPTAVNPAIAAAPPAAATAAASNASPSAPAASGGTQTTTARSSTTTTTTKAGPLPPIKHVFMIVLSNQDYNQTFGHYVNDPYLGKTLVAQGELVENYFAVAGGPLANEIALVSGQGPTPQTVGNCSAYQKILPGKKGHRGQILGQGCVYPKTATTIAGQLAAAHQTWKVYVQTATPPKRARIETCRPRIGSSNGAQTGVTQPYGTWRNPFLYFRSLATKSSCPSTYVGLSQLTGDLKSTSTTPALSYIVADACHDGSDVPCGPHAKHGIGPAEQFLKSVVPAIQRSPAYKTGGLIAITFDNAPQIGPNADSRSCCSTTVYPNLPATPATTTTTTSTTAASSSSTTTSLPTTTSTTTSSTTTTTASSSSTTTAPNVGGGATDPTGGGGQVGLLLISPYVTPGTSDVTDYYNHFSLLASLEKLFGLRPLGFASDPALPVFGVAVWNHYTPG